MTFHQPAVGETVTYRDWNGADTDAVVMAVTAVATGQFACELAIDGVPLVGPPVYEGIGEHSWIAQTNGDVAPALSGDATVDSAIADLAQRVKALEAGPLDVQP